MPTSDDIETRFNELGAALHLAEIEYANTGAYVMALAARELKADAATIELQDSDQGPHLTAMTIDEEDYDDASEEGNRIDSVATCIADNIVGYVTGLETLRQGKWDSATYVLKIEEVLANHG